MDIKFLLMQYEVIRQMMKEKQGAKLIDFKPNSDMTGDYYLAIVLVKLGVNKYVTWMANLSTKGFAYGHYYDRSDKTDNYIDAKSDFNDRGVVMAGGCIKLIEKYI